MNERVEAIKLDREGIAHFLNEQHQGWHDGMGSLSQTRVYGTALLLADAVRAALAQAERERDAHKAEAQVHWLALVEARATVGAYRSLGDPQWIRDELDALARVRAKVESLEFAIKDALHDLPDKGADAQITLRSALEGR